LTGRNLRTSVHYPPVHGFSIYEHRGRSLPVTEAYAARSVTLPLFPHMTAEQRELVVDEVRAALERS